MVFYPAGGKKGKKAAAALLSAVYLMTLAPLAHAETLEEQRDAHIEKAEQAQQKKGQEFSDRSEALTKALEDVASAVEKVRDLAHKAEVDNVALLD